jgi:hypothetical protein
MKKTASALFVLLACAMLFSCAPKSEQETVVDFLNRSDYMPEGLEAEYVEDADAYYILASSGFENDILYEAIQLCDILEDQVSGELDISVNIYFMLYDPGSDRSMLVNKDGKAKITNY